MSTEAPSSQGRFSVLPPELRLCVYESLFESLSNIRGQAPNRARPEPTNLPLLYASRQLYDEISVHLYSKLRHGIWLSPAYDKQRWMISSIESRGLSIRWELQNIGDLRRHLYNFPVLGRRLHVVIPAATRTDPGQIVLLWQKVHALIDVLLEERASAACEDVVINLMGRWNVECRPRQSVFYPLGFRPDHEIVLVPFSRLTHPCYYQLPPALKASLEGSGSNNSMVAQEPTSSNKESESTWDRLVYMNRWIRDTAIFLETSLDSVEGHTADMLRLERFSNWFKDGSDSWTSQHGGWLISHFPAHREIYWRYDRLLTSLKRRAHLALIMHHEACASVGSQPAVVRGYGDGQSAIYEKWDASVWYKMYPSGIPAFGTWRMQVLLRDGSSFPGLYEAEIQPLAAFSKFLMSYVGQ